MMNREKLGEQDTFNRLDDGIAAGFQALGNIEDSRDRFDPPEERGTRIGPYKLLQEIGEGGFGRVFMAEQLEPLRRQVAIKIIKPGMDTRDVIARFEAERQALAMMDHPNIARVFDGGTTEEGRPYFVMELVKGVPITEFCDRNNFATGKRLGLFMTVCRAVQHAHQKGIIHRDLKPSNIMVTLNDGQPVPKVIDFGVAKAISHRLTEKTLFTQYGQMIGTPQYMSPEQAEMSEIDVDTRSDIYSLGVILYELLTGTTPLQAEHLRSAAYSEMLRIIKDVEPAKPSTRLSTLGERLTIICEQRTTDAKRLRQLIRGDLDWVVMKALDKQRDRRYESANGLAADLQRHLNNEPVVARPPSTAYKIQKAWRRNKVAFSAAAAVIVSVMIGFVVSMFSLTEATRQRDLARRQVYFMHLANADRALLERDFQLARVELAACPEEQRGWEWRFLWKRMTSTIAQELPGSQKPAFTQDGKLIAVGLPGSPEENKALIWDTSSGKCLGKLEHSSRLINVALSPDGKRLAGGAYNGELILWDLKTRNELWTIHPHEDRYDGMAFSCQGLIATANMDGILKVFHASEGSEKFSIPFKGKIRTVDFSPDGKWIVAGVSDIGAVLVNTDTEKVEANFPRDGTQIPAFGADSRRIATGDENGMITLWNWDGKRLEEERSWFAGGRLKALDFSGDGSCLIASSWETVKVWNVETETVIDSFRAENVVSWLIAHPQKNRVAIFSNVRGIRVWDFGNDDPNVTEKTHEWAIHSVQFSPDGQWIAAGMLDGAKKIFVLDAKTGETINEIECDQWRSTWCPDSRSLVVTPKNASGTLEIRDAITGKQLKKFPGHGSDVQPFVDRNGSILTCVDGNCFVRRWKTQSDAEDPEKEFNMDLRSTDGYYAVTHTVDDHGRHVAIVFSQQYRINIFDTMTKSWMPPVPMPGRGWTSVLKFTGDGNRLFVGGSGHALSLHEIESGKKLKDFIGIASAVKAIALSPDEKQLASSEANGRVMIWDVQSAMPLISLLGPHQDAAENKRVVNSLDWSSDGRRMVAGRSDGIVQIWTLHDEAK